MIINHEKTQLIWKYELTLYLGGAQHKFTVWRTGDKVNVRPQRKFRGIWRRGNFPLGYPLNLTILDSVNIHSIFSLDCMIHFRQKGVDEGPARGVRGDLHILQIRKSWRKILTQFDFRVTIFKSIPYFSQKWRKREI